MIGPEWENTAPPGMTIVAEAAGKMRSPTRRIKRSDGIIMAISSRLDLRGSCQMLNVGIPAIDESPSDWVRHCARMVQGRIGRNA